ncbi:hypothetical protein Cgig2_020647 [Carnegiea gigantea]|uniref:Sulfite exporter TauE/SafE family protein n=1 Tax=Carnegiea gigantea TaxID=171969 RepID=A0A9Q1JYJ4_9CARY|nr:hypothetical protein Cgig2_020647 [Carnegiea gigantea]
MYLLVGFSMAVFSLFLIANYQRQRPSSNRPHLNYVISDNALKVWPKLEMGWRIAVATVIGFSGSAFGTVGGVGGGGIFVSMLNLIVGFDTKSSAALSKCTSSRSLLKGVEMWKEETLLKKETVKQQETRVNSLGELLLDTEYGPLSPREENSAMARNYLFQSELEKNTAAGHCVVLFRASTSAQACSTWYWVLNVLQLPTAFGMFGYEALKLHKEGQKRKIAGNTESVCEASIEFTPVTLCFCALCGLLGGTVGGLLGSGSGFILGPLLLEIGVIPQFSQWHCRWLVQQQPFDAVLIFPISGGVLFSEKREILFTALYLMSISLLAGFWRQYFVRKLVAFRKRASIIVFILSAVIFSSALTMGVIGIEKSIQMINNHEFMGFVNFCENQ